MFDNRVPLSGRKLSFEFKEWCLADELNGLIHISDTREVDNQLIRTGKIVNVEVSRVPWGPKGDVDSWLRSDLFDLTSSRSISAELALQEAAKAARNSSLSEARIAQLTADLAGALPATDPFWARWDMIVSRALN